MGATEPMRTAAPDAAAGAGRNIQDFAAASRLLLIFALCTLILLVSTASQAQTRKPGDRLTRSELSQLIPLFQAYVDEGKLAGLVTLVAHQGEIVQLRNYGDRELETGKRTTADTIYRIYSMSKPITSTAAMILIERGQLSLEDPVSKYLPEFSSPKVFVAETDAGPITIPAQQPITIRHLLTHTAGLTYGFGGNTLVHLKYNEVLPERIQGTLPELVAKLAEIPLIAQPGLRFDYSVSISVLGRVIEVASGQPLDAFIRDNISGPLGMHDTDFFVPESKLHRFADNYAMADNGKLVKIDDNDTGSWSGKPPSLLMGGAGMVSTITDYYRFCQMILDRGEFRDKRLLQPETVQLMAQNHLPKDNPVIAFSRPARATGFGYGFGVIEDPVAEGVPGSPGELFWSGRASTFFWIDPKEEIIAILMTQFVPPPEISTELRTKFKQIVYGAL